MTTAPAASGLGWPQITTDQVLQHGHGTPELCLPARRGTFSHHDPRCSSMIPDAPRPYMVCMAMALLQDGPHPFRSQLHSISPVVARVYMLGLGSPNAGGLEGGRSRYISPALSTHSLAPEVTLSKGRTCWAWAAPSLEAREEGAIADQALLFPNLTP